MGGEGLGDRKKKGDMEIHLQAAAGHTVMAAMASATAVGPSVGLRGQNTYVLEGTQELGNSTP